MSLSLRLLTMIMAGAICCIRTIGAPAALPNPILFITQVPMPNERNDNQVSNVAVSVVSPLGNHLGDTAHCGRGGDLWLRYRNGALLNLTRRAGFGGTGPQHAIGIAARDPHIHWSGTRALFSMVAGAPASGTDTNDFYWQLYEVTNLGAVLTDSNTIPTIVKVSGQPTNYNNVMACYGTSGRILFCCDRPRNGQRYLYPQLDEYNDIPTNTGLWSLDPQSGDLFQMDHSPSGSFNPFIDSFGRVIFTRWDHLVVDRAATDDRMGRATNGAFNFQSELTTNYSISNVSMETFPEPRSYDSNLLAVLKVQGQTINSFFPWMQSEDGTGAELLNHIGRHELLSTFRGSSFTNDPNLNQQFSLTGKPRTNFLNNFFNIREDPTNPGSYFGIDGPDFGMHSAGRIVTLYGPPWLDAEKMQISYVSGKTNDVPNAFGSYRDPLPMSDGTLVASYTLAPALDANIGTAAAPRSTYNFRLMKLGKSAGAYTTNEYLTPGITNAVGYYVGSLLVTNNSALWELQATEVIGRSVPTNGPAGPVAAVEAKVFAEEGVPIPEFQGWLRSNNLALVVSRNVTARDRADREQPFNLRVPGGVQTLATNSGTGTTNSGRIYDITYIQFLQADQIRGLTYGTTNPVPGRRVLATPMHDFAATNFNVAITNLISGATRLGLDGSQATLVPARRAMTHQITDNSGQHAVRERYWITYQPGEIRTCAVCHGLNTADQANRPLPTNSPSALRSLLRHWKDQVGYAKITATTITNGAFRVDVSGGSARPNILEASSDLGTHAWTPILTNNSSSNGWFTGFDPAPTKGQRFYRVLAP